MSFATTFDTLQFVNKLEKSGIPREQATAFVEIQKEILSETVANQLATKGDIRDVKNEIKDVRNEVREVVIQLRSEIRDVKHELGGEIKLLRWMVGLAIALSTGTFGLVARLLVVMPH